MIPEGKTVKKKQKVKIEKEEELKENRAISHTVTDTIFAYTMGIIYFAFR